MKRVGEGAFSLETFVEPRSLNLKEGPFLYIKRGPF